MDIMDKLFVSHITTTQAQKVLLVGKGKDIDYAINLALKKNININFDLLNTDKEQISQISQNYDLVIIVDRDLETAKKNHFASTKLKKEGSRVVFGLCRGLFFENPKWRFLL